MTKFVQFKLHKNLIVSGALLVSFLFTVQASADIVGQSVIFNVNSRYDYLSRTSLSATLRKVSERAYFYVEDRYWSNLGESDKLFLSNRIYELADEFDNNIYPKETGFWGSEPNPGIDRDPRITIVLENIISGNGGYFDISNQYPKSVSPRSNEREMVFINIQAGDLGKIFLGHEFQHLISFNQKEILGNIEEDVWLNEFRSEYSLSLLGYNDNFLNSSLERRMAVFLENPSDSLTEWPNVSTDYAHTVIFGHYLVERFGPSILQETLHSSLAGIRSLDKFLSDHGYQERFSVIFEDWIVANYLNDISKDKRYGYQREELKKIRIIPSQSILLYPNDATFSYELKSWQPTWHKFELSGLPHDKALKIKYDPDRSVRVLYTDNLGRVGVLGNPGYIINPGGLSHVVLMPVSELEISGFGSHEVPRTLSLDIDYVDNSQAQPVVDGTLIKRPGETELYVVEGRYKRYLRPEVIKLYGHLDPSKAVELDDRAFNSYTTANYVRYVDDKKIYTVWPDGTKHWLNMTGDYFTQSGRDWGSIFIINELEFNSYRLGSDIKQ